MASPFRDLLGLVLPVECAGCGVDDLAWCPSCAGRLAGTPWRCDTRVPRLDRMDGRGPLPVWTLADCTGDVRRAIIAWKDRGRADLSAAFSRAIADQARQVADELAAWAPIVVVPAPSTAASRRRRGGNLVDTLASGVASGLRAAAVPAEVAPVLHRARGGDQVGLGARDRARNLAGQLWVPDRRTRDVAGRHIVLVDDVLTTGATFAASRRALERAGGVVVAGLTLASTPGSGRPPALPPRSAVHTSDARG
ncbi:ComF family protein [Cellulomonas sp. URHE0023]|uniref:ComF family protein n=1 Tax=Cellulomonas sp. URHE0023 TaxID=1380354 RepID=UPI00047F0A9D|nr:phosphoribosyltransferase family protein [Cellulomonas sp. URHE0023]